MTKKEFNELTADLPDDSELYFYLIKIENLKYRSDSNNKPTITLYDE